MEPANLSNKGGYTSTISMSSDSKYLYVGVRSQGILIYNIDDPINPKFFQQLQLTGQSVSLRLSPQLNQDTYDPYDNRFIYYSNSLSVVVYQKQQPTLFRNIPNLFNIQQSTQFIQGTAATKWRCHISQNSKYLFGAFDADSLSIFKINIPSQSTSTPIKMQLRYQFSEIEEKMIRTDTFRQFGADESIPYGFYVDTVQFSKDEQYMYFTSSQYDKNVIAYKFKINISSDGEYTFQYVKGMKYEQVYYSEQMNISDDELHAVMSFDVGIVLIDMVEFEVLSMVSNTGIIGTCCGAVLSHDKKHALSVVRNVGLFIYDTSDMKNPKIVNNWRTNGGETLLRSKTDKIIYLLDGFNGIILLDSTKLPDIVIVGKFVTSGWTNFLSFTIDEKYGIISTMDTGTLTLIDLSDKSDVRIIMKSTIQSNDSQSSCIDPTGLSFIFSNNKKEERVFPLQSQVMIHIERQVKQTKTQTQKKMSDDEAFEVGMTYIVRFVSLYRKTNQILSAIYYYRNLVMEDLPSWMSIDRQNQSDPNLQSVLEISIPKECLGSEGNKSSYLIIVIKTCFQLDSSSFILNTSDVTTTANESLIIYKFLKSNGYIGGTNCVTDFFDSTVQQFIDLSDVFKGTNIDQARLINIQMYVAEILKRSVAYNQFIFNVISSLKFNQEQSSSSMVTAIQRYISIHFSFPQESPFIFIQKVYPNVIIYYNDELTVMKMEGDITYINKALEEKILYFDLRKKNDNSTYSGSNKISVQVMDNFNFDLNFDFTIPNEVKFLKEKSEINQFKNLQDQVNKQYSDASLTIEEAFLIEFDKQSFIDPDGVSLTYQFLEEVSGQYLPISSDSFIKQDNLNLRLVGTPPSTYLFTSYNLRLVVTNGYTSMSEDFYVKLNKMPFTYVFNKIIQILGPIAFVFGLYQKRSSFMNIYFKKNTMYSTEIAYINQMYRKKIAILGYDYEIANQFFFKFLKSRGRILQKQETFQLEQSQNINGNLTKRTGQDVLSPKNQSNYINTKENIQMPQSTKRIDADILSPQQSETLLPQLNDLSKQDNNKQEFFSKAINNLGKKFNFPQADQDISKNQSNQVYSKSSIPANNDTQPTSARKFKLKQYIQEIKFLKKQKDLNSSILMNQRNEKESNNNNNINNYSADQEVLNNLNTNQDNKNYQYIKNLVYLESGSYSMDRLFHLMLSQKLKIQFNLQNYSIENYQNEMQNQNSRFYYCLKACVIRYLLDGDEKTQYLYKFMKRYSLQNGNYSQNDWYKQYVSVVATNDLDKYGIPVPFSKTILKDDAVYEVLKLLQLLPQDTDKQKFDIKCLVQHQINPYLLQEVLSADALGLQLISAKSILKCSGESLHLENHTIISVEANKLVEEGMCLCLRKYFNLNYQTLPISKYLSLPSWMGYDYKNGVIILEGIPTKLDVNHILIRIYDNIHFACFQFHLKIEDNSNSEESNSPRQSPQELQQNEDYKQQINSDNKLIQSAHSLNRPKATSLSANNSIFKIAQMMKKQRKESPISEVISEGKSSQSKQQQQQQKEEGDSYYEKQDEIEEQAYNGIKSMTEYGISLPTPPIFSHQPKLKGTEIQLNHEDLKLNFQMPPLIQKQSNTLNIDFNRDLKLVKCVESFCEQSNSISHRIEDDLEDKS